MSGAKGVYMGNISLVIVTDDREYGRALGHALIHICSQILVRIMGKDEFFRSGKLCSGENPGLSAYDADLIMWDGEEAEGAYGGRIVLLSEKRTLAAKDFAAGKFCIYRYSQVQAIIADIFDIYSFITGRRIVDIGRNRTDIFSFVSSTGGTGCTTIAMSVAHELCRFRGKRVMYVSFEEFESTGDFIECPVNMKGAGVYLYHLLKPDRLKKIEDGDGERRMPLIESYTVRSETGLEAFVPSKGRNPLKYITAEELGIFIASLTDCGRYDTIVMDLGCGASGLELACMEISSRVCLVAVPGKTEMKDNMYLRHIICSCGEEITEKMVRAVNMDIPGRKIEKEKENFELCGDVSICRSSIFLQNGETKRIFLDGEYGNGIRMLTERITEPEDSLCDVMI